MRVGVLRRQTCVPHGHDQAQPGLSFAAPFVHLSVSGRMNASARVDAFHCGKIGVQDAQPPAARPTETQVPTALEECCCWNSCPQVTLMHHLKCRVWRVPLLSQRCCVSGQYSREAQSRRRKQEKEGKEAPPARNFRKLRVHVGEKCDWMVGPRWASTSTRPRRLATTRRGRAPLDMRRSAPAVAGCPPRL